MDPSEQTCMPRNAMLSVIRWSALSRCLFQLQSHTWRTRHCSQHGHADSHMQGSLVKGLHVKLMHGTYQSHIYG
jgi:hypothetical protein